MSSNLTAPTISADFDSFGFGFDKSKVGFGLGGEHLTLDWLGWTLIRHCFEELGVERFGRLDRPQIAHVAELADALL
ncbi:MAG TPA: hypothetical protein VMF06_02095 [Candidatus Limnocylindria bacterium]|nr:hypothetical protein [Candidatus Limnocylindria bacterium]